MNKILLIPVSFKDVKVNYRDLSGSVSFYVNAETLHRHSLMKQVLVNLAPMIVGTWAMLKIALLWPLATLPGKIGIGFAVLMVMYGSTPSSTDVSNIYTIGFLRRPWLAFRQILCVGGAALIYLWQADFFMQWHPFIPIMFEVITILGIFGGLDLGCYGLQALFRMVGRWHNRNAWGSPRRSRKYKIPPFAEPHQAYTRTIRSSQKDVN